MLDFKNEYELWLTYYPKRGSDYEYYSTHKVEAKSLTALAKEISRVGCYLPLNSYSSKLTLWKVEPVWHQPTDACREGRWSREHIRMFDVLEYPKQTISVGLLKKLVEKKFASDKTGH